MTTNPEVNYRMLTPLIRIKINTKQNIHYRLNDQLQVIINDPSIFPGWNNMQIGNNRTQEILPGIAAMAFNYNPLLFGHFPIVTNYPDAATQVLDNVLKAFALFKTTSQTKFKLGPRIVQTLDSTPSIIIINIRGSDDFQEFLGKNYELELSELDEFRDFYNIFQDHVISITNKKFLEALEFYAKATRTPDPVEKFVFLSVAFEFLFSKEEDELSYRFSNRIALLLGDSVEERTKIARASKNIIYKQRSKIVHGSSVNPPLDDVLAYFMEIMRISILRFISLFSNAHEDPIKEIDEFLLLQNENAYNKFRIDSESLFPEISKLKFQTVRTKIP